jgi:hypothetical protein
MKRYGNKHGNSGVRRFEAGPDYIVVHFNNVYYLYSHKAPGLEKVDHMKALAGQGRGLSSYISQEIKEDFEKKFEAEDQLRLYMKSREP